MSENGEEARSFSEDFDDQFPIGAEPGNNAFFGRDVLRGLVDGIDDFRPPEPNGVAPFPVTGSSLARLGDVDR